MKPIGKFWRLFAIVALVTILSLSYVQRTKAFTLIETQLLPAVQLVASQSAAIKVTNYSANSLDVTVSTFTDPGKVLMQRSVTIPAGQTFTHLVQAGATPLSFHAVIALGTANSGAVDLNVFDKTSGQVVALLPAVQIAGN